MSHKLTLLNFKKIKDPENAKNILFDIGVFFILLGIIRIFSSFPVTIITAALAYSLIKYQSRTSSL